MKIISLLISLLFPWWFVIQNIDEQSSNGLKKVEYEIYVEHPGNKDGKKSLVVLTQLLKENGAVDSYQVEVISVICLEEVCKVVPVKIYWNSIGKFHHYELKPGVTLEKYEDDVFEPSDYKKLNFILADTNSPFKEVAIEEVVSVVNDINDVDGISGATTLALDKEDTIAGASLTCYTLWHWANGALVEMMQNKTGEKTSEKSFLKFLESKQQEEQFFALEQLSKQKKYSLKLINQVVQNCLDSEDFLSERMRFIEESGFDFYKKGLKRLFTKGGQKQILTVIQSMEKSKYQFSTSYFESLSKEVSKWNSYPEISSFIDLLESKKCTSPEISSNLVLLLKKDILIARHAYWFLSNQKLTEKQNLKMKSFYKKNRELL